MSQAQGYGPFARFYDGLTGNVDYAARADRLHRLIAQHKQSQGNLLLDLACGTGSMCEAMAKLNYDVLGVDCSPEMLGCAMEKKIESSLPIQYLCQDMRELDMFGTIDVTLCMLDSLNHLPGLADVEQVFRRVSLFAEPGGLFLFDMNTLYKHEQVLGNNCFYMENDSVCCVWQNQLRSPAVDISLDFFEKEFDTEGELYRRSSEAFTEQAYDPAVIDQLLTQCGFVVIDRLDGDQEQPLTPESQRILWIARKESN